MALSSIANFTGINEAYTSIRAAGFTRQEIDDELFQNRILPRRNYQNISELNQEVQQQTQSML
ncbi:MAG: hypothetical protein U7126_10635 [Microcoleus sp.]